MHKITNGNINLYKTQSNLNVSSEKLPGLQQQRHLSANLKTTSIKDDTVNFTNSTKATFSSSGLIVAQRNDAISLMQKSESTLQETTRILQYARELALQSATGTNSAADRSALQSEINQLKQELTKIVTTTAIGVNKLSTNNTDGIQQATYLSFLGGGTNSNAVGIGTDIGVYKDAAVQYNGYAATVFSITNLASSKEHNIQTVNTVANDDAATIANTLSAVTGVNATGFNQITLSGTAQQDTDDEISLSISGSGADVTVVLMTGDSVEFSFMAEQINSNTNLSSIGVYAVASASDVTVYATQGQDFVVDASSGGAALAISATSGVREAAQSADLTTANSSVTFGGRVDVQLDQGYTIAASDVGIFGGTANVALTTTASGLADITGGNSVAAQTLTISGSTGSGTVSVSADDEASAIVTKINNVTSTTNVKASAKTTLDLQGLSADGTITFDLFGDNVSTAPASISAAITTTDFGALIKAINDVSGNTGITAATNGANNVITLTHSTGKNISIKNFTHSAAQDYQTVTSDSPVSSDGSSVVAPNAASLQVIGNASGNSGTTVTLYDGGIGTGFDSTVVGGEITFTSSASFSVSSSINGSSNPGSLFGTAVSAGNSSTASTVNGVDISTASGAQSAISVLDEAINQVSEIRADLGAIQSRFESAIRNISSNVENLNVARSRILDTDFAAETAALTKAQILSQAGVSVLAQANALPQNVLALLQ